MKKMIRRRISGILLSLALMLGMIPVLGLSTPAFAAETRTVTWNKTIMTDNLDKDNNTITYDGITLKADLIQVDGSGNIGIQSTDNDGTITVGDGKIITKIEIHTAGDGSFFDDPWEKNSDKLIWKGDPGSDSVAFRGTSQITSQIEFTIGPALVEYPVWVGNRQVTNYNNDDVFGDGKVSFKPSDDGGSATLILNNYSSPMDSAYKDCGIYIGSGVPNLVIHLEGDNDVRGSGLYGMGVCSESGNLTFTGSGTLDASGMNSGINANQGYVSVRGATLKASSNKYNGYGIYAGKNVTIYSGSVDASATVGNDSYGIYAKGGIVAIEGKGSPVVAAGGRQAIYDIVKNVDAGIGWTDVNGTSAENTIDIDTEGQRLDMFKKVQFPAYSGEPVDDTADDSGNGSSASSTKVKSVNTGDENDLRAWTVLFCAALTGTAGMAFARKRSGE